MNGNSYTVWSEDRDTKSLVHMADVFATSRQQARRLFMKNERFKFDKNGDCHPNVVVRTQDIEW